MRLADSKGASIEPPLLGRAHALRSLTDILDRTGAGRPMFGLVEGEAGIGKSRLLGEIAAVANDRAFRVFVGAAAHLERNRPFGPLIDALDIARASADELRRDVWQVLATNVSEDHTGPLGRGPSAQFQVLAAFLDLIEREAEQGPTLLVLEDLHWSEASTLLVIRSLAKRGVDLPLVVLGSFRPSPRLPELDGLVAELVADGAVHLVLDPLGPDDVTHLVEHLVNAPARPSGALMRAAATAGGNPLFVIELVTGLQAEGLIDASQISIPPTIATTILRRLNLVAEDTAEILRVAAVLGSTFSPSDVSLVSERPAVALLPLFDEAMQARVIEPIGSRLRFRHDLVRDAIYESMPIAIRLALHQQAGRALASAGSPALQVAEQLALGARTGDTQAIEWVWRAARETMSTAPAAGARLLERALELAGRGHTDESAMLADLVLARVWSGRGADAVDLAHEVLGRAIADSTAERVRFALMQAYWMLGRWEEGLAEALERCRAPGVSDEERGRLLAETTHGRLFVAGPAAAISQSREALSIGRRLRDDATTVAALQGLATSLYFDARYEDGVAVAEEAVRIAEASTSDEPRRLQPHFVLAQAYVGADRLGDSERTHQAGRAMSERIGSEWGSSYYLTGLASRRFFAGDWDDAVAEAEAALALADELGTDLGRTYLGSMLAVMQVHRGRLAEAERAVDLAIAAGRTSGAAIGHDWVPWAHALVCDASGRLHDAFNVLSAAFTKLAGIGMVTSVLRFGPDLVRLALATDERAIAADVARECEGAAVRSRVATAQGVALRCRGLVEADADVLVHAVATFRRSPRRVELALAMEDAARLLVECGRLSEAVPLYEESLTILASAGAARDQARITSSLRALGVRRGTRGGRNRPASGWEALTKTELAVVRLVTEGLSNPAIGARLFISRHTVETHLRHVFEKLGVRSRAEVAATAARQLSKS